MICLPATALHTKSCFPNGRFMYFFVHTLGGGIAFVNHFAIQNLFILYYNVNIYDILMKRIITLKYQDSTIMNKVKTLISIVVLDIEHNNHVITILYQN